MGRAIPATLVCLGRFAGRFFPEQNEMRLTWSGAWLVIILALPFSSATGAEASLEWTNATQREDGTALAAGELRETQIDYAKCVAGSNTFPATRDGVAVFPFPAVAGKIPGLAYGKWCFRARHVDSGGLASLDTGTVWAQYLAPPKPPTLLTVKGLAWEIKTHPVDGPYLARVVGTVEAGKPCRGLSPALGFDLFYVERQDVALNRGVGKNATLVAQCSIEEA
jgi:hypothetical protein